MQTIGIIGGGKGGAEVLNMIRHCAQAKAAYICDKNTAAPGCLVATKSGIPVFTEISQAIAHNADYVFDLTGSSHVQEVLRKELPHGKLVNGDLAYLLFCLVDSNLGEDDDDDTLENKYLTFSLCEEEYALPVSFVKEIVGVPKITHIPEMPAHVKGTVNLRESVIPVVDVRLRFGFPEIRYTERTCVILVEVGNHSVGLIVDEVKDSVEILPENIEKPPRVVVGKVGNYVRGISKDSQGGVKIVLNPEVLLEEDMHVMQL
jgi:purine-binding chemotaxis protein CheW